MCSTASPENTPGWYRQLLAATIMQFPRPEEIGQEAGEAFLKNQGDLRQRLSGVLVPNQTAATDKFVFVKTFDIVVPADYQHGTQLKSFSKKHGKSLYYLNDNLTDKNFSKVSAQLKAGQKVTVNVYRQTASGSTTSEERMTFLRALPGNKFYGAQGASLVYEQKADQLERGFAYVAMDEKDNLPLVDGNRRVPRWDRYSGGDYGFCLGHFEFEWLAGHLLFSFSDAE